MEKPEFKPREMYDLPEEFVVISDAIIGHGRWSTTNEIVIRRITDDTFWRGRYDVPATECQDWDTEPVKFCQVWPRTKLITVYTNEAPVALASPPKAPK